MPSCATASRIINRRCEGDEVRKAFGSVGHLWSWKVVEYVGRVQSTITHLSTDCAVISGTWNVLERFGLPFFASAFPSFMDWHLAGSHKRNGVTHFDRILK